MQKPTFLLFMLYNPVIRRYPQLADARVLNLVPLAGVTGNMECRCIPNHVHICNAQSDHLASKTYVGATRVLVLADRPCADGYYFSMYSRFWMAYIGIFHIEPGLTRNTIYRSRLWGLSKESLCPVLHLLMAPAILWACVLAACAIDTMYRLIYASA